MEGCPLLTHQGLRAVAEGSVEARRPLLAALQVLDLSQSAGARSDFSINIERLQYRWAARYGWAGCSGGQVEWVWSGRVQSLCGGGRVPFTPPHHTLHPLLIGLPALCPRPTSPPARPPP